MGQTAARTAGRLCSKPRAGAKRVDGPHGRIDFMTETAPQLATLLQRSSAAAASEPEARDAIELAVGELVEALRHHHMGTAEHSNRLAVDCHAVGEELGLAADAVFELELVAILHDIGKLAVPAAILDLARPLNSRERAVVRGTRSAARRSSPRSRASRTSRRSCGPATSAGTAPAIRTASTASGSRSRPGSCSRSTRSTR